MPTTKSPPIKIDLPLMTERAPDKTLVVGEPGSGKTSLVRRYVDNQFTKGYLATIGVECVQKVVQVGDVNVRMQLWDIAGQDRFKAMMRAYFRLAVAAVVVFDITKRSTFDAVVGWKEEIDTKVTVGPNEESIPCLLLANKCDLPDRAVSNAEITALAQKAGFIGWFEVSAKTGLNLDKAFLFVDPEGLSVGCVPSCFRI